MMRRPGGFWQGVDAAIFGYRPPVRASNVDRAFRMSAPHSAGREHLTSVLAEDETTSGYANALTVKRAAIGLGVLVLVMIALLAYSLGV